MDLLLALDVYETYLLSKLKINKSASEKDIENLFSNGSNRVVLSRKLIELLEISINKHPHIENFAKPFLAHLINNQSTSVAPSAEAKTEKEILTTMFANYNILPAKARRDIMLSISSLSTNSIGKRNSVVIEEIVKPNFHWIWFKLASHSPNAISLRYFDFSNNQQIEEAFDQVLKIPHAPTCVDIYDRQANLTHNYFNSLKHIFINYYTSVKDRNGIAKVRDIKNYFRRVNIYDSSSKNIHERRIVCNNLIIESDEDFPNLTFDRPTWKIDFTYSPDTSSEISKKKQLFKLKK
jgi:hypothetical protein